LEAAAIVVSERDLPRPASLASIAAWEFSLGVYLTFRGFNPSPITADM